MAKKDPGRIATYIPGLDPLIEGGFKKNSINLIVGGAGTGKTIFALQFLVNGILKHNEVGIYITFEEKKREVYDNMKVFDWDLAKLEKQGKFIFLEYSPERVKTMLVEGGGLIETIITKSKAKRLVIDSITAFTLLYKNELAKKEAALSLFGLIRSWDCTTLLTEEEEVRYFERAEESGISFEVDSIILLYREKEKGIRKRAIEVLKMRGTTHTGKTLFLDINKKKGVVVNPKKIVSFKD